MTDGDLLLRAVLENPACDTARLVYADWLQEHGQEPSARFIRYQIDGTFPAVPPLTWLSDAEPVLGRQPHEVYRRGFKGYATVSKLRPAYPRHVAEPREQITLTYRRGFVDAVDIDHAAYRDVAGLLFLRNPVRKVRFWSEATEYVLGLNGRAGRWTFDINRVPEYLLCGALEGRFRTRELALAELSEAACDFGKREANKVRERNTVAA